MQKGQALLLILLSMSVVLVVALSIVSRSVTDISNTTKEESSTRAFNAAESGVERVLVTGSGATNQTIGDANFTATVSSVGRALGTFNYPVTLNNGDSAAVWLTSRNANGGILCDPTHPCFTGGSINVCWGNQGTPANTATTPALEVHYFYITIPNDYGSTRVATAAFDPYTTRVDSFGVSNGFAIPDTGGPACVISGKTYAFQKSLNLTDTGGSPLGNPATGTDGRSLLMTVRLLYNTTGQSFGVVAPSGTFPAQGNLIDSNGTSGGTNRRLNVFQSVGDVPAIFNNVVYSDGTLTK